MEGFIMEDRPIPDSERFPRLLTPERAAVLRTEEGDHYRQRMAAIADQYETAQRTAMRFYEGRLAAINRLAAAQEELSGLTVGEVIARLADALSEPGRPADGPWAASSEAWQRMSAAAFRAAYSRPSVRADDEGDGS
jgi:hypothetical protein